MITSKIRKTFNFFIALSLIFQSFAPILVIPTAYAEDTSASSVQDTTTTPEPTVEATPEPETTTAPTEAPIVTDVPTEAPAQVVDETTTVIPTAEPTPENTVNENAQPTAPPASNDEGSLFATVLENVSAPSLDLDAIVEGQSATLTTDKPDYAPTDTALISGTGLTPNKNYSLTVSSDDAPATSTTVIVPTNNEGNFVYAYQLDGTYRPNYSVVLKDGEEVVATVTFTDAPNPATDISQCQNGGVGDPLQPCSETAPFAAASGYGYEGNAAANSGNSHWTEGEFVPLRIVGTNYVAGAGNIQFSIDVTKGGKHAYDYIGSFDATETTGAPTSSHANHNNPCGDIDVTGDCTDPVTPDSVGAVPAAALNPFPVACGSNTFVGSQIAGSVKAWGTSGPLTVSYVTENVGSSDCTTTIQVAWTNTQPSFDGTIVIAYGAHIARQADWGTGNSAISIPGSPYHTSLVSRTTGGDTKGIGNQDAKLSASAVVVPSTITIHKVTSPNASDSTSFTFNTTGTGYSGFGLTGGTQNQQSVSPGNYTVTETVPGGWGNTALTCGTVSGTGTSATPNLAGHSVSITIGAGGGGTVDCTFTNTLQQAHLTLLKTVTTDNGGTALDTAWTLTASGPTNISGVEGNAAVTNAAVNAGAYTLGESGGPSGYTAGTYSCVKNGNPAVVSNSITLAGGDNATCTINNNDNTPSLTLVKEVTNNDGGDADESDFTLTATGPTGFSGAGPTVNNGASFDKGTYNLSESGVAGYTGSDWLCVGGTQDDADTVTLGLGESATCTITNSDNTPKLKLVKTVDTDNGGDAEVDDWTLHAEAADPDDGRNFSNAGGSGVFETVFANADYVLSETDGPNGYTAGDWECNGGTLVGSTVTLDLGDEVTCTINNDDQAAHLTLLKTVVKDNGGDAVDTDWTLTADGPTDISGVEGNAAVTNTAVDAGTYTLGEESGPSGYSASEYSCVKNDDDPVVSNSLTLGLGDSAVCTITNDDIQPKLTVIKHVINDNGGTASASSFSMFVTGTNATPNLFGGDEAGTEVSLDAGEYVAGETAEDGYEATFEGDCSGTIAVGDEKTCTITNDDIAPVLHLRKVVTNNNGGDATVDDFTLTANGTGANDLSGTSPVDSGATLKADTFALSETNVDGYSASAWSCVKNEDDAVEGSSITLGLDDEATCTITNDDIQPKLTLIKHVTNNSGGTLGVSDFPLFVDATGVTSGVKNGFNAGTYTASETSNSGYDASDWSGDCADDGSVTLNIGDDKTCEITNDDLPAHLIVIKHVINDDGDEAVAGDFTMHLTGTDLSNNNFPGSETGVNVTLDAGAYSADETDSAGYIKTLSADCSGTIANGQTKTCTITNNDRPFATRTQGFWQTHTVYTTSVFSGNSWTIGTHVIDTPNELFAGFYASLSKLSNGKTKRSALDQARMQMLQQWLAAKLNCEAFGCSAATQTLLANAATEWGKANPNINLLHSYASQLDAYNNSNDALTISGQGKATPQTSQSSAASQLLFWDVLP